MSGRAFRVGVLLIAVLAVGACATSGTTTGNGGRASEARGFVRKSMTIDGRARNYVLYVPRRYDAARPWPLLVFLHGKGERGDDGISQTTVGIGRAIRRSPHRFPCLVLMPQCPEGVWWDAALEDIQGVLEQTFAAYSVDSERVYLTGLSMGGFATWMLGARERETFAALMPIAGAGRIEDAAALAGMPIWAFHGAEDTVVPVEREREMVDAVRKAGGNVRYTEYRKTGHNAWDRAYGDREAVAWLLAQKKERKPSSS